MAVGIDDLALVNGRIVDELGHMAQGIGDFGPATGIVISISRDMAQRLNAGDHLSGFLIDGVTAGAVRIRGQR